MSVPPETPVWDPAKRVAFRFVFVYFLLYLLPFPLNSSLYGMLVSSIIQLFSIPADSPAVGILFAQPYQEMWNEVVPWVGEQVFHTTITVRPNGSGDTTYNYVQVFCFLILAGAVTALWSLLDRKRRAYPRLFTGLRVYVRFGLATVMITYGAVKVIKSQFPNPPLDRLLQPFGDASPMGLLWTFMGASESYNVFSGVFEMLGGMLLTTRRTTLLGALLSMGVLGNIVMLNFSYDVPVKLYSAHLFVLALFLAAPDLGRIARLFLLNRAVEPAVLRPRARRAWVHWTVLTLRSAVVIGLVATALHGAQQSRQRYGDLAARSPLYGVWNVEEFVVDGKDHPPLVSDSQRWRRVVFDYPGVLSIQLMSDARQRYTLQLDTEQQTLALRQRTDPVWKTTFRYQQPEPEVLALEGVLDGKKVRAQLRRVDESAFLLTNRGFHWMNEYPFNR